MKFINKFICIIILIAFLLNTVGCGNIMDAYIYFELPSIPSTLDPQTASTDSELIIIRNIQEGLFRKNSEGKIICGLADSYTINGLEYEFKLRENAKWSNGEKITAHDFEFALKRAVNPETKAPFVSRLFCITGAKNIYNKNASIETLGIKATDNKTLKISLDYADSSFLETLTTSIAMPCNEKFFYETSGKYGLGADNILSSGSYKLSRWRKDAFGIRLYRNNDYTGFAQAQNAAVFVTCNKDEPTLQKLQKNSIDIAFIDSSLTDEAKKSNLKTTEIQNICWFLTLSDAFTPNMRKALTMTIGSEIYSNSLPVGYTTATSVFPDAVNADVSVEAIPSYNPVAAKELYLKELEYLKSKKFPSDIVLYFYDNGKIKNVVTDIVGHWQNNFSAFVNIESVSENEILSSNLKNQTYEMAIFSIKANNSNPLEYLEKFNVEYDGKDLNQAQINILETNKINPIMFQNTVIAYSKNLNNVFTENGNGYIDFSYIVKPNAH